MPLKSGPLDGLYRNWGARARILLGALIWSIMSTISAEEAANLQADSTLEIPSVEAAEPEFDVGHADVVTSIRSGLRFHPSVSARRNALDAALMDRRESWGGYLPRVDLGASSGLESRYPTDRDEPYWVGQADLTVSQMLFDGFRTRSQVDSQQYIALVRYHELEAALNDLALQVLEARENVVRHQRLLDLARDTYRLNRQVDEQIKRRVANGHAPRVDAEQMAGRMALAESNLMTAAANLHDVSLRLQRLTGRLPGDNMTAADLGPLTLPENREALLDQVLSRNPDFLASVANVRVSDADIRVRESQYYPELSLRGRQSINHNTGGFDDRIDTLGGSTAIELVFSYNLYRGGSNQAALGAALTRSDEARDDRYDACLFVQESAQVAFNDSDRLRTQLDFLSRHQSTIDEVRKAYRSQFDIGQRSLMEILDIETEYLEAARARINGEHDLTLARARTLHSMNQLLPELGIERDILPSPEAVGLPAHPVAGRQYCDGFEAAPEWTLESLVEDIEIEPISAPEPEIPPIVLSAGMSFGLGSAELTEAGRDEMRLLARQILSLGDIDRVRVEGHTDSQGPTALNQRLSEARAAAAAEILIEEGFLPEQVESVGFGPSQPVADNETEAGRQANRRIEIRVNPTD